MVSSAGRAVLQHCCCYRDLLCWQSRLMARSLAQRWWTWAGRLQDQERGQAAASGSLSSRVRAYVYASGCLPLPDAHPGICTQVVNVVQQTTQLDGNGFLGSDGWMPGDYGALESVWTLDGASVCVFVLELGAVVCAPARLRQSSKHGARLLPMISVFFLSLRGSFRILTLSGRLRRQLVPGRHAV